MRVISRKTPVLCCAGRHSQADSDAVDWSWSTCDAIRAQCCVDITSTDTDTEALSLRDHVLTRRLCSYAPAHA